MNKAVPVADLLGVDAQHLQLKLVYGKQQLKNRYINNYRIQKPGLALAGFADHIHGGRVQVLGNTELSYLWTLKPEERFESISHLCKRGVCCFIVTKNLHIPKELLEAVKSHNVPLLKTHLPSSDAIQGIMLYLEEQLAPETHQHGVFMDIFGIGVLITGRSGIGKSECAIELIKRGHRLVADDAVHFRKIQEYLEGQSSGILRYHMEVRGLGILNIKDMFGVTAIRQRKKLELVVEFTDWNPDASYDRLGLDNLTVEILKLEVPKIILPISAGRNMAVIVEVAARNHLLKIMGYDSAKEFSDRLLHSINPNAERTHPYRDIDDIIRRKRVE
ncbi:HPr kinase [Denitrovibrio acetiphilus DSM 12809]|uniref:HPr kinase/phosphorylase n=1 Tax=Denitrovibrio acetiphilus (strain DSM 12809 / NBRC 114555 / N2460) TaxID=522772 RepID=D4H7T5_DENA2|nr:HPr(Ser) kinase/phosphatase [Denitrovibrio acetiphilus]ADD68084.1 HPr kinase [Denitrovibrio acetiphilus DSM 12809]